MADNNRDQSEFNMAVSYLNRLNNLFYLTGNAAISLDMYSWYHSLQVLFRELSTEMKDPEINQLEKDSQVILGLLARHMKRTGAGPALVSPELYSKLHKFEMHLRRVMKESGLQTKIMDNAMLALR